MAEPRACPECGASLPPRRRAWSRCSTARTWRAGTGTGRITRSAGAPSDPGRPECRRSITRRNTPTSSRESSIAWSGAATAGWPSVNAEGRGQSVFIDRRRHLTIEPAFSGLEKYPNDPRVGTSRHAAIRPGDEWNTLTVRAWKRRVEVLVNGAEVVKPIDLAYDLTPAAVHLSVLKAAGDTQVRAEYDRVEIREIVADASAPSGR